MNFKEQLCVERYRLVTSRQKYFTELARGAFASYWKVFTAISAGGVGLVSFRSGLNIDAEVLKRLLYALAALITVLGVASALQVWFCLARWKGYAQAERTINPECPKIKEWWWLFEALYVLVIAVSILVVWFGSYAIVASIMGTES